LNLLEAVSSSVPTLIVTTDKVYSPSRNGLPFGEGAHLGGSTDPYSASKAMADILTSSWSAINLNSRIGIVRAGNVIGGGDDSDFRLIPDILSAFLAGNIPVLRHPNAVRPWQHVLDCLNGYLAALDHVERKDVSGVWNIGPTESSNQTVLNVLEEVARFMGVAPTWEQDSNRFMPETGLLSLSSEKARLEFGWAPSWGFQKAIGKTVEWEQAVFHGRSARELTQLQIKGFLEDR
jgi:CDP-glucose 4,6-dehydratase